MKRHLSIEIVSSTVLGLSSLSHASRQAMLAVLSKHYSQVRISIVNNMADLAGVVARRPDLVFLGMKFIPVHAQLGFRDPAKIWLSQYFDECGIRYTGSNQLAHSLEFDKPLAKQRLVEHDIMTAPFYVARQHQLLVAEAITLPYPVFIKPTNRGGGAGIDSRSVATDFAAVQAKVQAIAQELRADALIEAYLPGREFSVAILQQPNGEVVALPIELVTEPNQTGHRMLSKKVKVANGEQVSIITDIALRQQIEAIAQAAFYALGARDYGRIDIRLDKFGVPNFLEANLLPSLIDGYGSFPKACLLNMQLDYEAMLQQIVELGLHHEVLLDTPATDTHFPISRIDKRTFVPVPETI